MRVRRETHQVAEGSSPRIWVLRCWWARSTEVSTRPAAPGRFFFVSIPMAPAPGYISNTPTAKAVAFERSGWKPSSMLPTFELGGVSAGATICHDHYLGLLPRFLARCGARLWVNPSFDNVTDINPHFQFDV